MLATELVGFIGCRLPRDKLRKECVLIGVYLLSLEMHGGVYLMYLEMYVLGILAKQNRGTTVPCSFVSSVTVHPECKSKRGAEKSRCRSGPTVEKP